MNAVLSGQLVVAERVWSNEQTKELSIENIRNYLKVNTYPSVAVLEIWVKLWIMEPGDRSVYLKTFSPQGKSVWEYEFKKVKNMRNEKMPPGIDFYVKIRFVVQDEGVYRVVMHDRHSNLIAEHPVFISADEI
ncbi:hypothetical protein [Paenibacillus chitinolyticus]|uniref:hypothetical protein n=1 Tax=Paenibacillus chitinolyticus TaxID=79263 RepID=UPI001C470FE0|nr:hypothetical protein [Paenibacillus chitinolyticus]MBV6717318.1 hypothetical protein [Paenibacillus chitinolyticus]